jgi:hypothetical protein
MPAANSRNMRLLPEAALSGKMLERDRHHVSEQNEQLP